MSSATTRRGTAMSKLVQPRLESSARLCGWSAAVGAASNHVPDCPGVGVDAASVGRQRRSAVADEVNPEGHDLLGCLSSEGRRTNKVRVHEGEGGLAHVPLRWRFPWGLGPIGLVHDRPTYVANAPLGVDAFVWLSRSGRWRYPLATMRVTDESRVTAASWIAAAMAVRFASKVFDDVPTGEACDSAHDLLVELKLARRVPSGPPVAVDALVAELGPRFSKGFPDEPSVDDAELPMAVALVALKRFSDHCDKGGSLEELVDTPDWVPSLVSHALQVLSEVAPQHYAN
jgi:hypothetical protein